MPGLNLQTGFSARASGGSYTPLTPAAAQSPSASNSTIGQMAYGVNGSGSQNDRGVAGYGAVATGIVAIAALCYLWWSLPR